MFLQNTYNPLLVCLVVLGRHYPTVMYKGEGLDLKNILLSISATIYFPIVSCFHAFFSCSISFVFCPCYLFFKANRIVLHRIFEVLQASECHYQLQPIVRLSGCLFTNTNLVMIVRYITIRLFLPLPLMLPFCNVLP